MLLHCKYLQRSPDAFNHKEVGYSVTKTQNRAKHESCMGHLLFTFSSFSIYLLRVDTKKKKKKVKGERRERGEDFRTIFKWRVLRKAFLRDREKIAQAGFVVTEAAVREFHFFSRDLISRSSPRCSNGKRDT